MDARKNIPAARSAIRRLVSGHLAECVGTLDERYGKPGSPDEGRWLLFLADVTRRPAAARRYLSTFAPGEAHAEGTAWEAGMLYGLELAAGALRLVGMSRPPQ